MMAVLNPQSHGQFVLKLEGQGFIMTRLNEVTGYSPDFGATDILRRIRTLRNIPVTTAIYIKNKELSWFTQACQPGI